MKTFLVKPLITEKSLAHSANGVYQFIVPTWVNKEQVAQYIADHFGVTVETVNTARLHADTIFFRRKPGKKAEYKKATVTLKKGDTIAAFALPTEPSGNPDTPIATEAEETKEAPTESKITVRSKKRASTAKGGA